MTPRSVGMERHELRRNVMTPRSVGMERHELRRNVGYKAIRKARVALLTVLSECRLRRISGEIGLPDFSVRRESLFEMPLYFMRRCRL